MSYISDALREMANSVEEEDTTITKCSIHQVNDSVAEVHVAIDR